MTFPVLANFAVSIADFKRDPMGVIQERDGETVLIIEQNGPAFYAVPTALYEAMVEIIDDFVLPEAIQNQQSASPLKK